MDAENEHVTSPPASAIIVGVDHGLKIYELLAVVIVQAGSPENATIGGGSSVLKSNRELAPDTDALAKIQSPTEIIPTDDEAIALNFLTEPSVGE